MKIQRNKRRNRRSSGGSGRDSGGDDSGRTVGGASGGVSRHSGGSTSTGSDSPGIQDEEKSERNPVPRFTYPVPRFTYPVARFTNVHADSTPEDIRKLFRRVGQIRWFCMFHNRKGNFLGEAEVVYLQNSNAHKAVRKLHDKDFKGKPLNATVVEVYCTQRGSSRTNYTPSVRSPVDSEIGSVPETGKGKGKKRKKSPDEEEDDPDTEKTTKQLRGIKIG